MQVSCRHCGRHRHGGAALRHPDGGPPWFQLTVIAASPRSAGKTYEEAVKDRWAMTTPIPEEAKNLVVLDAQADIEKIAGLVDFVFCAVDMKKDEIRALEEA